MQIYNIKAIKDGEPTRWLSFVPEGELQNVIEMLNDDGYRVQWVNVGAEE